MGPFPLLRETKPEDRRHLSMSVEAPGGFIVFHTLDGSGNFIDSWGVAEFSVSWVMLNNFIKYSGDKWGIVVECFVVVVV